MSGELLQLEIRQPRDVVLSRQQTRQLAALLGFDAQDQTRLATAVSEIVRNALSYGRDAKIDFRIEGNTAPQLLVMTVSDRGPGIAHLSDVLAGRYRSPTGMGLGIVGTRRLMDKFEISSTPSGTTVVLKKLLPRTAKRFDAPDLRIVCSELRRQSSGDPVVELQQQNQELLRTLGELSQRQQQLAELNHELEDTNRGVVALYAELDEKADHLRRADELKSRFLSNMSHEFRTPVNSIQALARILLERQDGDLTTEQEIQINFIRKAAESLSELVNDLLDLAKVEAGKTVINPVDFEVDRLFGALRGMLRPLLVNEHVALTFEPVEENLVLHNDEAKVSQILRNFISNALKFTERGEIRVSARALPDSNAVAFSVADTGIGIAVEDQDRIFNEFSQIDNPIQRKIKGTGLGLPLCRKLAELLGGYVTVASTPEIGSAFTAVIPTVYHARAFDGRSWNIDPRRSSVLFVEDSAETVLVYEKMLAESHFQVVAAGDLSQARSALKTFRPAAIVLDILLGGEEAWELLAELKRRPDTRTIPLMVVSTIDDRAKGLALGADQYCVKPIDRQTLLRSLTQLVAPASMRRVLIVDDEDVSRYILRQHLLSPRHVIFEAASGSDALDKARSESPDVICLDLTMPDLDGYQVMQLLKADPTTCDIPIVLVTSHLLEESERTQLASQATAILSKNSLSRDQMIAAIEEATQRVCPPSETDHERQPDPDLR